MVLLAWGVNARAVVVPHVHRPEGLAVVCGGTLHRQLPGVMLQGVRGLLPFLQPTAMVSSEQAFVGAPSSPNTQMRGPSA